MGDKTGISWTDATWNPVVGCTRVSPGCDRCYAETLGNHRYKTNVKAAIAAGWKRSGSGAFVDPRAFGEAHFVRDMRTIAQAARSRGVAMPFPPQYDLPFNIVQLLPDRLDQPLRWKKPRRIFVNSVSDLFHEDVPWQFVAHVFGVMARAAQHRFQILTKRAARMNQMIDSPFFVNEVAYDAPDLLDGTVFPWPLPNVWLGVSVEDQQRADERIPLLLETPAAVRFISAEPLLGAVELTKYVGRRSPDGSRERTCLRCGWPRGRERLRQVHVMPPPVAYPNPEHNHDFVPGLDWIIAGGESGAGFRPMDHAWARSLRDQCAAAGVAFFMKQGSGRRPGQPTRDPELDRYKEFPA